MNAQDRKDILKICLGILLAFFIMSVCSAIFWGVTVHQATQELEKMATTLDKQTEARRKQEDDRRKQEQARRLAEKQKQDATRQHALDAQNKDMLKERTWSQWYIAPPACVDGVTGQLSVECVNHRIRAKRYFDSNWVPGKDMPQLTAEQNPFNKSQ